MSADAAAGAEPVPEVDFGDEVAMSAEPPAAASSDLRSQITGKKGVQRDAAGRRLKGRGAAGSVGARRPLLALLGLGTTLLALLGASGSLRTTLGNEGCRLSLPIVSFAKGSSSSSSKAAHLA